MKQFTVPAFVKKILIILENRWRCGVIEFSLFASEISIGETFESCSVCDTV